jgi:hypothetical protein
MLLQDATHNILVHLNAEGIRDLLGDSQTPELRIPQFHFHHGGNELGRGPFGPGLARRLQV